MNAYEAKGTVSERKVKGEIRLVDTWKENGKKKTHILTADESEAWSTQEEAAEFVPDPVRDPSEFAATPEEMETLVRECNVRNPQVAKIIREKPEGAPNITHYNGAVITGGKTDENRKVGEIEFDHNGKSYTAPFKSKHTFGTLIGRTQMDWAHMLTLDPATELFQGLAESQIPVDIRVATLGDQEWVLPLMSSRFSPLTVEDLVHPLAELVGPGHTIKVTESDGIDGGSIEIEYDGTALAKYSVNIHGGNLIGTGSIKMFVKAKILFCQNQLTALVAEKIKPLVGVSLFERKVHSGEKAALAEMLDSIHETAKYFLNSIQSAKDIELSDLDLNKILEYYKGTGMISKRVAEKAIMTRLSDNEIQQIPGTVFGLAMVLSHAGTHDPDLKDGVRARLNSVAGELVLVSPKWSEFAEIVTQPTAVEA